MTQRIEADLSKNREFLNPSKSLWRSGRYVWSAVLVIGLGSAFLGLLSQVVDLILLISSHNPPKPVKGFDMFIGIAPIFSVVMGVTAAFFAHGFLSTCCRVVVSLQGIEVYRVSNHVFIPWDNLRSARYYRLSGFSELFQTLLEDGASSHLVNYDALEIGFGEKLEIGIGERKRKIVIRGSIVDFDEIPAAIELYSRGRVRFPNLPLRGNKSRA